MCRTYRADRGLTVKIYTDGAGEVRFCKEFVRMAGRQVRHHAVAGAWTAAQFGLSGLPDPLGDGVQLRQVIRVFMMFRKTSALRRKRL